MSVAVLDTMTRGLTAPYQRGMEQMTLVLGATGPDGTTTVAPYDFSAYTDLYGTLPDSPRYLLIPAVGAAGDPLTVRVWFKRNATAAEDPPATVEIPAGWASGRGIAVPIPGAGAAISSALRLTRFQPQPPASQLRSSWTIVSLLGNLAKLLWVVGAEHEELAQQLLDVSAQRSSSSARSASLDLLGEDLGVPRFPPTAYTWDPDTLALYHLDGQLTPTQTQVLDDRSRYQPKSHPGVNNGAQTGAPGRFSGAFSFAQGNAAVTIADDPEFALPAGSAFTVEAIIKRDPAATAAGAVIAKRTQLNSATAAGWALSVGPYRGLEHNLRYSLSDGTAEVELFADRDLGDGTFHHVAGVLDHVAGVLDPRPGLTLARLYLDGVEVARQTLALTGPLTNSAPVTIGFGSEVVSGTATAAPYRGVIDEVRISRIARSSFHPVVGEGDDQYRRRLQIFQGWLLPTADALPSALNMLVGPVAGDAKPFIVDEQVDPAVIGTLPVRVLPAPLASGQSISADGDMRASEADTVGAPADEPNFDVAWLLRHPDQVGLSFGGGENSRLMQHSVRLVLDRLLTRLGSASTALTVVTAYDPDGPGLHSVGRALVLTRSRPESIDLAVAAHAAGFSWVRRNNDGSVYVAQALSDVFAVTPAESTQQPPPPDVVEGQDLALGLEPSPAGFADAITAWRLIHCGHGDATLGGGPSPTLHARSAGNLTVHVDVRRRRHTGTGTRTVRIGLSDTSLATGQSIAGDGRRGVTEEQAAGAPGDDFSELYLETRTDDLGTPPAAVDYGGDLGNRRMQRGAAAALDRLLALIAGASGKLTIAKAFDPAAAGLLAQGRALWLRHATLSPSALAARAFAAGFDYIRVDPAPPVTVQVAVAASDQIAVSATRAPAGGGVAEIAVGQAADLTVQPQADPVGVAVSPDGSHAYVVDRGTHRVSAFTLGGASAGAFPAIAPGPVSAVAPTPSAVAGAAAHVYVAHELTATISVLDPVTLALSASATTGPRPTVLAADGNRVFVGCAGDSSLRAIDTGTGQEVGKLVLPAIPLAIAPVPGGSVVYVVIAGDRFCQVNRSNLQLVGSAIATGTGAVAATVTPDGTKLYVACAHDDPTRSTGTVRVYATSTNAQSKVIGGFTPHMSPSAITVSADGKHLYLATTAASQTSQLHIIDTASDGLLSARFTSGGKSQAVATSPAAAPYAPCLLVTGADTATLTLADPAPVAAVPPQAPRIVSTVALGTGGGERLAWATVPFSRGRLSLTSLVMPGTSARGVAPGATLVRATYFRGQHLRPYQFEVRLNDTLDPQPNVTLRKDQYDLVMNVLNSFHPLGVEVITTRLRAHVLELSQAGADLSPGYTYPVYQHRGLSLPQPTNPA